MLAFLRISGAAATRPSVNHLIVLSISIGDLVIHQSLADNVPTIATASRVPLKASMISQYCSKDKCFYEFYLT
jgi:hypothetical protein